MRILLSVLICCLLAGAAPARAGEGDVLLVAAEGKGAAVYADAVGSQRAGLLYNGYCAEIYPVEGSNLWEIYLNAACSLFVHPNRASKNLPASVWGSAEQRGALPCTAWVGEVCQPEAPFYREPGRKNLIGLHAQGTQVLVWGEFGRDYLVSLDNGNEYFMPADSLRRVRNLPTSADADQGLMPIVQGVVHTGGPKLCAAPAATRVCDEDWGRAYKDGEKVEICAYGDGWVQLAHGSFLESRFLDPAGDHSRTRAAVKTSGLLQRLNVRWFPRENAPVQVKLYAGTQVEVVCQQGDWAVIFITGPAGGGTLSGCVKKEFLTTEEAPVNGCPQVRLTQDVPEEAYAVGAWRHDVMRAGEELTLIGVAADFLIDQNDRGDGFYYLTAEGRLGHLHDADGRLEPLKATGLSARTERRVSLWETPSTRGVETAVLAKGQKVDVLLRGEGWTLVRAGEQTGYILSRYLRFP